MGGRGGASGLVARQNTPVPPPAQQPAQQTQPHIDAQGFSDTDDQDFHNLLGGRAYYQKQTLDIDAQTALPDYLDPNTVPGSLYNASQEMNYAVAHGTMNPQQQYMYDSINNAMHNLGQNLNLTRYDHGGALDQMLADVTGGRITSRAGMTIQDLKDALVGGQYSDNRILSTSFNDFKNAQNPSTFTTREVKIVYKAKASTQAMMPGIGSIPMRGSGMQRGDDFGEMLLAPTGNGHNTYEVKDVRYSGNMARPKGGSAYSLSLRQIEVVVEVE